MRIPLCLDKLGHVWAGLVNLIRQYAAPVRVNAQSSLERLLRIVTAAGATNAKLAATLKQRDDEKKAE
jgi:hypothetical protein